MERFAKQLLSILLCAVLLLSVLPARAVAETDPGKILTEAYALKDGASLSYAATLTGKIITIKDPYSNIFENISVVIEVPGYEDMPVVCYRMRGDGADTISIGNTITVTGTLTNYYGIIEFKQGCTLDYVEPDCCIPVPPIRDEEIVDQAYLLAPGAMLPYTARLTGQIVSVDTEYSDQYKNITVTIAVEGKEDKPIVCFRLRGEGAERLKVGDTITVSGALYHYQKLDENTGEVITDQIEFMGGCTLDGVDHPDKEENLIAAGTVTFENWEDAAWGFGAQFIPGEDGTVTVTVSRCDPGYYLNIYADGEWVEEYLDSNPGTVTVNVTRGVTYAIDLTTVEITSDTSDLSCWDYAPGSLDFSITADVPHGEPNDNTDGSGSFGTSIPELNSLAIVGSGLPGISEWNPADPAGDMTEVADGIFEKYLSCPANAFMRIKIAGNDAWDDDWNFGSAELILGQKTELKNGGGSTDMPLSIDKECIIRITVDLNPLDDGGAATILVEEVGGSQPDLEGLYSMAIVGSGLPGIPEWYPADPAGDMTEISTGVFMKELRFDAPGQARFRFAGNDMWDDQWSFGGDFTVEFGTTVPLEVPAWGADITLDVPGPCTVEFYLDLSNGPDAPLMTVMASPLPVPGPVENTYRVVGNADWMGNWDPASDQGLMEQVEPGVYSKTFEDVPAGDYEFRITANGVWDNIGATDNWDYCCFTLPKTTDLTVILRLEERKVELVYDAQILGDMNGDSKLNVADVSRLYAHIRGTATLTDPNVLAMADFGCDGKVNIADVSKLYAYVRGVSAEAIIDRAYALEEGEKLPGSATLTGAVLSILEPYQSKYNSLTVVMVVFGRTEKPIICTRLTGEDAACVEVGDIITVTGTLQNYYGTVEFAEGCRLDKWVHTPTAEEKQAAAVDAAYALQENTSMDHPETLTGKVLCVDQAYSDSLPYICITIAVPGKEDQPIGCYRLVGENIARIMEGDTVTVTGTLRNYYGTVEFASGCQLESYVPGSAMGADPLRIIDAAYNLPEGAQMAYDVTLTGKVIAIDAAYSPEYKNISVTIAVSGREDKPIMCYRLKGDGVERLAVSDTITVQGRLHNYYGVIEFDTGCQLIKHSYA